MKKFIPLALTVLAAICGGTAAVNSCLDLNTGKCTSGSSSVNLARCGMTDDDIEDLKACFAQVVEGNIEYLSLYSNDFTMLPAGIFDSFGALTRLVLDYNELTTLPAGIFDSLRGLTELSQRSNGLTSLPAGVFDSLGALTELDLAGNAFTTLTAGVFDSLTALETLHLSYNKLEALPAGLFDSLGALTTLSLYKNYLETLPAGIFDFLGGLTSLNLVLNDLKTLPDGLFDSTTLLTRMDLSYNELETLPAGLFDHLALLTEINLSSNDLIGLPAGLLDSLTLLTEIRLDFNDLTTLPAGIFDSTTALTYINLGRNNLEALPDGVFDSLSALKYLWMTSNALTSLPMGIFDSLGALFSLLLSGNSLTTLPPDAFDSLKALDSLDLRSNDLTTLPAGIFDSLEVLGHLYLGGNEDLACLPAIPPSAEVDINEFTTSCDCDFGDLADPCEQQGLRCTPGSAGYLCAAGCDPEKGNVECEENQVCCDDREVCVDVDDEVLYDPTACGDPHMTGFLGQKFDFTGEDGGWYSLIASANIHINMRVTSPVPDLPEITYITGLSVLITDADGFDHSIVVEVKHPHSLASSCPAGVSPCLADGSLSVILDGEEALLAPGTVSLSPDVEISAANLPGACRSFGFEEYWERKKLESASRGRRLSVSMSMGEWILGDPTATNMDECEEYVARAEAQKGGMFVHQSEHASFQIVTPTAIVRLSHGMLHQIGMRDPTDQYNLPDHRTWQMNIAVDHNEISRDAKGILGETFVPTRGANGEPIMVGMEAIRGQQDDYLVEGALGLDFAQDGHA